MISAPRAAPTIDPMPPTITTTRLASRKRVSSPGDSDWNVAPQIDQAQFTFAAPEGAKKLEEISADEIGELSPPLKALQAEIAGLRKGARQRR